ncbi:MAG: hypothetical protein EP348_11035 [Alphaproteobacteria bacterium]|nr:MAG: hypothetical protein EP348_11035 [Alphaproteobacteria bacterium]
MKADFRNPTHRLLALALGAMALIVGLFIAFGHLDPKVSPDFFFGSNDPALARSAAIHKEFPADEFLILSVASNDIYAAPYLEQLSLFTKDLARIKGISRVISAANGPEDVRAAAKSPFWRPLLISRDDKASLILAFVDGAGASDMIEEVETAAKLFDNPEKFHIRISGTPYIAEQIRRNLIHDMALFSGLALLLFLGVLYAVFRSPLIAFAAAGCGITAVFLTLLLLQLFALPVGILSANLILIVFVLTQSQAIYLTANWHRTEADNEMERVRLAIRKTLPAAFWCMVTTLLGFASLLLVAAEPLRELGAGGMAGAFATLLCGLALYPVFLLFARPRGRRDITPATSKPGVQRLMMGFGCLIIAALAVPGLFRLNTDPGLLSYFGEGSELREGLSFIDQNGGSSPLKLVVARTQGGRLDNAVGYDAMWKLHRSLRDDPSVGTVLSLPALMAEANDFPLAFLLPWREIISLLSLDYNQRIAANFLNDDRTETLFLLRMKEEGRDVPRAEVVSRLEEKVAAAGFKPVLIGGVYALQAQLATLVSSSLLSGTAALLCLFAGIAFWVSRSFPVTLAMTATAALIPVVVLGFAGLAKVPVDIISAPAANVAFGIAVDALIHLALSWRRQGSWQAALTAQKSGILTASGITAAGFLIFVLSGFPPTARFGGEIVLGAGFAGLAALTLFPMLARAFAGKGLRA